MPVSPTYPGVYIEEVPSGVRTIVGVPTAVTAFLGRTQRGPVNRALVINGFADFEQVFGGLWADSPTTYAVRDFFLNGGGQAVIVRLFNDSEGSKTTYQFDVSGFASGATLPLEAASPGSWATGLRVTAAFDPADAEAAERYGVPVGDPLYDLVVIDTGSGREEHHLNLSTHTGSVRHIAKVLESGSALVRWRESGAGAGSGTGAGSGSGAGSGGGTGTGSGPDEETPPPGDPISQLEWAVGERRKDLLKAQKSDGDVGAAQAALESAEDAVRAAVAGLGIGDGGGLRIQDYEGGDGADGKSGLRALDEVDIFNLMCIPPDKHRDQDGETHAAVYQLALAYCEQRRAMLLVDAPIEWTRKARELRSQAGEKLKELGLSGKSARNAAIFYPNVLQADPEREGQQGTFAPCGIVAGVMARTDNERGVWKAPAGVDASLNGIRGLDVVLTDDENGQLNPLGINCLRSFPVTGRVVWGARTLRGADRLADEYKYIPIRRLVLYIEETLYRGTQWVVFEPNDEPLWAQIRLNVGAFMHNLFRQGAFQGADPDNAYLVQCDAETTTQYDIDRGIVNIVVGFAPLKPAEFVIIKIQQLAGQLAA